MADLKLTADFTDLQTLKRELLEIPKKARDSARTFEAEFARAERILVRQAKQFQNTASASQKYYTQLLQLNTATKSAESSAQVFARELEKQDRAATKAGNAAAKLEEEYRRLSLSGKSATDSARVMERAFRQQEQAAEEVARAARQQAQAVEQSANSYRQLKASIDPAYRAQQQLLQAKRTIRQQLQQNNITMEQAVALMRQYRQAQLGSTVAVAGSTRGINGMGMVVQQTGYQVGDFLVQVQGGTNFMVAFGQQATQLAGILPMLGAGFMGLSMKSLVALSAGLGIAIPLFTAVAAGIMRTRGAAEEAKGSYEGLGESLSKLEGIRLNAIGESLASGARQAVEQWQNVLNILERGEVRNLENVLQQQFDIVIAQLQSFENRIQTSARLRTSAPVFDLFGLSSMEDGIRFAQILNSIQGDSREELQEQLRLAEERLRNEGLLTAETETVLANLADQLGIVNTITTQVKQEQDAQKRINSFLAERVRSYTEVQQSGNELLNSLMAEVALNETILKFGEDSAEVENRRAVQAREAFERRLDEERITGELRDRILEAYETNVRLTAETEATANAAKSIAEEISMAVTQANNLAAALDKAASAGTSRQRQIAVLHAQISAAQSGASTEVAGARAGTQFDVAGAGGDPLVAMTAGAIAAAEAGELEGLQNRLRELTQTNTASGAGAGAGAGADPLAQLQERLRLETELLGKSEAQQRVIQALGLNWRDYGDKAVSSLLATIEELDATNAKIAEQQQLADTIENSMSDAFMSMVDGTKTAKDAFRDMARSIIKQLYDVLVVQRLVGSFNASTGVGSGIVGALMGGFGGGASFGGGRESGGSMMAGRPYLVGERGPELVIPGRSATVMNADLTRKSMGGSDGVVVNQTINVNGGTDPAAIRMEVAKLMPQITNATKAAVIDARRRGGQMKAAFQ